jgi:hypothetical protein
LSYGAKSGCPFGAPGPKSLPSVDILEQLAHNDPSVNFSLCPYFDSDIVMRQRFRLHPKTGSDNSPA